MVKYEAVLKIYNICRIYEIPMVSVDFVPTLMLVLIPKYTKRFTYLVKYVVVVLMDVSFIT